MGCCFSSDQEDRSKKPLVKGDPSSIMTQYSSTSQLTPDDFKAVKVLGKGSFGKVLLVIKKGTENYYAMKILKKKAIEARKQRTHTLNEKRIMQKSNCPFIVQLKYSFQTKDKLYMVMEFMKGGELFFHLKKSGKFTEERARFYAAEILLAFEYLHNIGVIYRDLKPENILIDDDGHIKITDFGLSKLGISESNPKAFTFCGTPEYLAPEILKNQGHDKKVDFWSLGAVLYEMISGAPPFYSKNRNEMYKNVLNKPVEMKPNFSNELSDFLTKLLQIIPEKRLSDMAEIKKHQFFHGLDWEALSKKRIEPPFKPRISSSTDLRNFDPQFTTEPIVESCDSTVSQDGLINPYPDFTYIGHDDILSTEE
ncbi:unnamed protein product [Blepharisma stoltei]|uniref:Uncharacterized protein n=1 Tax=Blepharisma stoltei TaxID=1481888 RepID=A0AAU9ISS3_9CILI|nr:unnamed protein product [Blepharisma stoltei]